MSVPWLSEWDDKEREGISGIHVLEQDYFRNSKGILGACHAILFPSLWLFWLKPVFFASPPAFPSDLEIC